VSTSEAAESKKGNGVCLPGYTDAEGDEMPWLLGTAEHWQNGGAYIFRPSTPDEQLHVLPPKVSSNSVTVYESDLVTEVHAEFGEEGEPTWIKQITRIISGKDYVEVEYVVGPVPIADGVGKEVVSRFTTSIESEGRFYTDSNGREFMQRVRGDHQLYGSVDNQYYTLEPLAGNFYPVNTAIYVEDPVASFSIVTDRSQGGSSMSDGSIELMIQRRGLHDDARGVAEPLNETDAGITPCPPHGDATRIGDGVVIKGIHRLIVGGGMSGASLARANMDETFSQPHVFAGSVAKDAEILFRQSSLSLTDALPDNIMLVTFASLEQDDTYLVRLGHQYGVGESHQYSLPVEVDLGVLFPSRKVVSITETTLSGNQRRDEWEQRQFQWWNDDDFKEDSRKLEQGNSVVSLEPMEIRTFEVKCV
jgi:alpha-mannosidase